MQPFLVANDIERRYGEYIRTAFPFADPDLAARLRHKIEREHLLGTGPIVALQRPFMPGPSVAALHAAGEIHVDAARIFENFQLHAHQAAALRRLSERGGRRSTLIATGTGSGKTEGFLLPILDYCARHPGDGVKALLVYPMNALANDQLERLRGYLNGTGITFGRYTGDTPSTDGDAHPGILAPGERYRANGPIPAEECFSRDAIRRRRPNILITGYRMLEYLLVRREDQAIFRPDGAASQLAYLVLDEVHTYAGALGAEVACLVRRLRGHIDRYGDALTCVGASATVGDDQQAAALDFASRLFAVEFETDALVQESYANPIGAVGALESVDISQQEVNDLAASTIEKLPPDRAQQLFDELDAHPTIVWLREKLSEPRSLDDLIGDLTRALGRESGDAEAREAAQRQIAYFLLRGTMAYNAEGALLRPRLHVIHRGIADAAQCLQCAALVEGGAAECPECGARAVPLEICRQCGQDYLRLAAAPESVDGEPNLHSLRDFEVRRETRDDLRRAAPGVVRLVRRIVKPLVDGAEADDDDDTEAEQSEPGQVPARVCVRPDCGHVSLYAESGPCVRCADEATVQLIAVQVGPMRECAACRSRYGVNREPITGLSSSTAIGVSILTWLTLGNLSPEQRKLLIFADSRQDTAYQAGYLQDVTSEYSWRQLTYRLVGAAGDDTPDLDGFWNVLFNGGRKNYELFSSENASKQKRNLRWFALQEFSREGTRRASLENLGLVGVEYRFLGELQDYAKFGALRALCPGLSAEDVLELLATTLDFIRHAGAMSDDFTTQYWDDLDDVRGVDAYNRRPVGFRRINAGPVRSSYANARPFVASKGRATAIQSFYRRLDIPDAISALAMVVDILEAKDYIKTTSIGGTLQNQKLRDVFVANVGMMALRVGEKLWQCTNCGTINWRYVRGRCYRGTCDGVTLISAAEPDRENFYVHMYRDAEPIALHVREHSGQLSGAKREEYEHAFRDGKINVMVASPTLELGVDIGALTTVLLRGLPPSPANYAQRAGRAGRRERIAIVSSYAQTSPHDAYFVAHPEEMIAGSIPAPHFELDNATIVRRHIRSLALEKIERPLPRFMRDFLDIPSRNEKPSPEDYINSKLRNDLEAVAELRVKRSAIMEAVVTAFREERGFACLSSEAIGKTIDEFEHDLFGVLRGWHAEIVEIATDIARINALATPTGEEHRRRAQMQRTLVGLTMPSFGERRGGGNDAYTLGYLANHGFLPSYAFPGTPSTLFSRDLDDGEVQRDPLLALGEFAPGALVYVDGKKIRCTGLNLVRTLGGSSEDFIAGSDSKYVRCSSCGYHAPVAWIGDCPECGSADAQLEEPRLEVTAFRGAVDAQITASEEQRRRTQFDLDVALLGKTDSETTFRFDAATVRYCRNQPLLAVNRGLREVGGTRPFLFCLECGDAKPEVHDDWKSKHLKLRKHAPKEFRANLTHAFESDVLLLEVPSYGSEEVTTLRHALLAAIRIEFQADEGELGGFDLLANEHRPTTVALFETVNGGAGYLRRAASDLPRIAKRALAIIQHDPPCVRACYTCLLHYYNQRDHDKIDKRLVETLLRELSLERSAPGELHQGSKPDDGSGRRAESPIELLLDAAMRRHLPPFERQGEVFAEDGKLVSRPDMLFPAQRVAIYADGHAYHTTPSQIENDNRIRNRMRELGYKILAFTGSRIAGDPDGCVGEILNALEESI